MDTNRLPKQILQYKQNWLQRIKMKDKKQTTKTSTTM